MENENNTNGEISGFDAADKQENPSPFQNNENTPQYVPNFEFLHEGKEDYVRDIEQGYTNPGPADNSFNNLPPRSAVYTKHPKKYGAGVVILSAILAALIGAGGALAVLFCGNKLSDNSTVTTSNGITTVENITVDEKSDSAIQAAAQKASPSVVGIRTTFAVSNFFGGSSESSGEGSGFVYSKDGYIITNYHVIESAVASPTSTIEVFFANDTKNGVKATIVGYNISNDLAVIKVNKSDIVPIEIAKSNNLKTGQYVAVIGCPGGIEFIGSVTYGVVSGLNRKTTTEDSDESTFIQTDAAINPGNSGGAMVNTKGELVGVPSSKIVSQSVEGMGFAIPSDTVVKICDNIIAKENSPEPYLGVTLSTRYDSDTLQMLGYPAGVVVQSVAESSPAQKGGLQRGDIITEFNGKAITSSDNLAAALNDCSPSDTVTAKFFRSGRYYSTSITIGANT